MSALLASYLPIVIFVGVALIIGLALLVSPFLVAFKAPDDEKLSAYECGFDAFDDSRMRFDVRFYLVSILFIIFDLEVAFLFPWAASFGHVGWFGLCVDDGVPRRAHGRLHLRVEERSAGMELIRNANPQVAFSAATDVSHARTVAPAADPFVTDVNNELADKGFLVTSTEDLIHWARTAP